MIETNLIPADRRASRRRKVHLRVWIVACLSCALLLAVGYGICNAAWNTDDSRFRDDLAEAADKIAVSRQRANGIRRDLVKVRGNLRANRAVGDQPDWSVLLAVLAINRSDDIVLSEYRLDSVKDADESGRAHADETSGTSSGTLSLESGRFVLKVTGFGRTQPAVSRFLLRLESVGLFDKVTLKKGTRQAFMQGEAVAFELECLLGNRDDNR